jgi:hypothetical protein
MTSSLHIAREVLKLPLLQRGLGGFGFSVLERDKPHYNIILMVPIRKEVISRNRKPPLLLTGIGAFKLCRGQTNGILDNFPQKCLRI